MTDSAVLSELISCSGLKKKSIAKVIGITPYSLAKKISNVTEFKASEVKAIADLLGLKEPEEINRIFFA